MAKPLARGDNFRDAIIFVRRIRSSHSKAKLTEEMQHEDSVRDFRRSLDRAWGSGLLLDQGQCRR
jgi:hypothetical protein